MPMRQMRLLLVLFATATFTLTVLILRDSETSRRIHFDYHNLPFERIQWPKRPSQEFASWISSQPVVDPLDRNLNDTQSGYTLDPRFHPIRQLTAQAHRLHGETLSTQSRSLKQAVDEYRKRYGIPPPPNFDKWYEYATKRKVVLVDEYDSIQHMLLPFWALKPKVIRGRTKEALGFDNALIGLSIRDGKPIKIEGGWEGYEWQRTATMGMIEQFVQFLPDMDIAFNIHDEPRVVLSHDSLSEHVQVALSQALPAAARNPKPVAQWSARPADMSDGEAFAAVHTTRFNRFSHQATWTNSRLSCPPSSSARSITRDDNPADDTVLYATPGEIGFLYNHTAFTDICNSPSLERRHGFFDRPNAFCIVHDLFPIFSQSKISSFQDIVYPSPWYWAGKVTYDPNKDYLWDEKVNKMYWRGSTTGGFSRDGGWRRQHRQRFMRILHANDEAKILTDPSENRDAAAAKPAISTKLAPFTPVSTPRVAMAHLFNASFSLVSQCDPPDCEEQTAFFEPAPQVPFQSAWKYRHLLDIDGNAFSGRFYAFLKSESLTYKMAIFREWHDEWIRPWVHYVPLSLEGSEWVEAVRWLSGGGVEGEEPELEDKLAKNKKTDEKKEGEEGEELPEPSPEEKAEKKRKLDEYREKARQRKKVESEGEKIAREMARMSTEWHDMVLRKEDFETWFFRLLLEYGRLIDDNRENLGYSI